MKFLRTLMRRRRGARGSALLLTMFTIAALLTLGTTFIAISIGHSRETRGDKDSQLARTVALYGINWVTAYMSLPTAWRPDAAHLFDDPGGSSDGKLYTLRSSDNSGHLTWLGRTVDMTDSLDTDGTYKVRMGIMAQHANNAGTQVSLPTEGLVGVFDLTIEKLSGNKTGQSYLKGQPSQYAVTSVGYLFRASDANSIYNATLSSASINSDKAVAIRSVTMRVRPQNPLDFAIYEANMRSWNIPGFNTQFGLNNFADNGMGTIDVDASHYDQNDPIARARFQKAQNSYNLLQQMYSQVQLDSVGIPANYTMKGNFRADGSVTPGDPFKSTSGTIHVFATDAQTLASIQFTGNQSSFVKDPTANGYEDMLYDGSFSKTQKDSIFKGPGGPQFNEAKGLPAAGDYMTSYLADTTNWPTPDPADPLQKNVHVTTAEISKKQGKADGYTLDASNHRGPGYVKVSTPASGAVPVTGSTTQGADIEILDPNSGGPAIQQPGFARVQISIAPDPNDPSNGIVTMKKVGAYSGLPVTTSDPPFDRPYKVSEFPNGVVYVDGGNVEMKGDLAGKLTVVAAASSDRPTVATPAKRDANGQLVPQAGLPVLITPDQQATISTSIYRSGDDPIFHHDTDPNSATYGKITNIPAYDAAQQKYFFPAYDPRKVGEQAGDAGAVTSEAPLTREGNVTIVGDIKKSNPTSALGIVAQNYVLLSDQTANKTTLQVDGTLMSMQRSVQYGGFLNKDKNSDSSGTGNPYYQAMGSTPDSTGKVRGNIPRPATALKNTNANPTKFILNGSIIGQYADVEASKAGDGYAVQTINSDQGLRSSLPPLFPTFSRDQGTTAPITWVVVAVNDSSSSKAGTVQTGQ